MNARWLLLSVLVLAGCGPRITVGLPGGGTEVIPVNGNTIKRLKQEVIAARAAEAQAKSVRKAKEAALEAAELAHIQHKLYWACGACIAAAIGCFVLAVFLPAFKKWAVYGCLTFVAIAALSVLVAKMLPYLIWLGVAVAAAIAAAAVYYWRLDSKSRDQIVAALEDKRNDINSKLPGLWKALRERVDVNSDLAIDATRRRLGKL